MKIKRGQRRKNRSAYRHKREFGNGSKVGGEERRFAPALGYLLDVDASDDAIARARTAVANYRKNTKGVLFCQMLRSGGEELLNLTRGA